MIKTAIIDPDMNTKMQHLVLTAFELFHKHGIQRISVEEICHTARVSKVTFYKYFANKDDLLMFIIRRSLTHISEAVNAILDSGLGMKEIFDEINRIKRGFITEIGDEFLRGIMQHPESKEIMDSENQKTWEKFRQYMLNGQSQGSINPRLDIDLMLLFLNEVNRMFREDRLQKMDISLDLLVNQVNELLIYGILSREGEKA